MTSAEPTASFLNEDTAELIEEVLDELSKGELPEEIKQAFIHQCANICWTFRHAQTLAEDAELNLTESKRKIDQTISALEKSCKLLGELNPNERERLPLKINLRLEMASSPLTPERYLQATMDALQTLKHQVEDKANTYHYPLSALAKLYSDTFPDKTISHSPSGHFFKLIKALEKELALKGDSDIESKIKTYIRHAGKNL